jgi:hypothetical protein
MKQEVKKLVSFIRLKRKTPLTKNAYQERHHIIPKAIMEFRNKPKNILNGNWNIISLTPADHFEIHILTYQAFKSVFGIEHIYTIKTTQAINRMMHGKNKHKIKNKEEYEMFRIDFMKALSINNPSKDKNIVNKKRETYLNRTGYSWGTDPNQRKQTMATNLKKYGCTSPLASEEIQQKSKDTLIEKYGVTNISQVQDIKNKKKETSRKKYGTDSYTQTKEGRKESSDRSKDRKWCYLITENIYKFLKPMDIKELKCEFIFAAPSSYDRKKYTKTCEYCKREIDPSNFKRWHGNNCKHKTDA